MAQSTKNTKRQKKTVEDADFFLYNSEEDTQEIIEVLGLSVTSGRVNYLDSKRQQRYDDGYQNDQH